MAKFKVYIGASKIGAIGALYHIKRSYIVEARNKSEVAEIAIKRAYQDGDIEHVRVETIASIETL